DREDVIQYVYRKYGERYAAMVCNVVTYRSRSASREVAKALGFRPEIIDVMAKSIDAPRFASRGPEGVPFIGEPEVSPPPLQALADRLNELERTRWPLFRRIVEDIADFPQQLSIHTGGMLITALPLVDTVPVERATMPDRNVVQFDKR